MKIIITGASKGIGYDTALELVASGSHQVLALSRNNARLQQLAQEPRLAPFRNHLQTLALDLARPDFPALERAVGEMGGVEVLINNAGLLINKPFADLTADDWRNSFDTNIFGAVELIRFLLPHLRRAGSAHIVNIGSMGGFQGSSKFSGLSAYSSSKAALANLTECLAEELKTDGISVNCLALGAVATEMLELAFPGYKAPVASAQMAAFLAQFATTGHLVFNGKILPVSVSTP